MIDRVKIYIKAGDGGDGVVSFRHEKFVPYGGPDGGDGGRGGSVILAADSGMSTLRWFGRRRDFRAQRGENGAGKKMHGKNGEDLLIRVPLGTVISVLNSAGEKVLIADLAEEGQRVMAAKGGRGGLGNARFATSTYQAPRIAQRGERGEEATLILDLKLIADVGIIGCPNVGKSTLLASASAARPKIADYPFTTKEPILGVVDVGNRSFVLAEIPGLIEGAHRGLGLGHDFLRHAERTRLLIHVLDGTSQSPLADMEKVNQELSLYNPLLHARRQVVAVNKIDIPEVQARIPDLERELSSLDVPVFFISAATTQGVSRLMAKAAQMLDSIAAESRGQEAPLAVFRPQPRREIVSVSKEGEIFVVSAPKVESLAARMDLKNAEALSYIRRQCKRMGVSAALKKAGAKPGDKVRLGEIELEWE